MTIQLLCSQCTGAKAGPRGVIQSLESLQEERNGGGYSEIRIRTMRGYVWTFRAQMCKMETTLV